MKLLIFQILHAYTKKRTDAIRSIFIFTAFKHEYLNYKIKKSNNFTLTHKEGYNLSSHDIVLKKSVYSLNRIRRK